MVDPHIARKLRRFGRSDWPTTTERRRLPGRLLLLVLGLVAVTTLAAEKTPTALMVWARFEDVQGVTTGTPVVLQGFQVGEVTRIELDRPGAGLVDITFKVWLRISDALPLPAVGSRVQIEQALPIQPASLRLFEVAGAGDPTVYLNDGEQITVASPQRLASLVDVGRQAATGIADVAQAATGIPPRVYELLDDLDSALAAVKTVATSSALEQRVNRLLADTETKVRQLTETLTNDIIAISGASRHLMTTLSEVVGEFDPRADISTMDLSHDNTISALVYRFNRVSRQMSAQIENLSTTGGTFDSTIDQLKGLLEAMEKTLGAVEVIARNTGQMTSPENINTLNRTMASAEVVLQRLAADIDVILGNLNGITWNLQELTRELRRNPSAVIWGSGR